MPTYLPVVITLIGILVSIGLAVVGTLIKATEKLSNVATKLDLLCDRLDIHEVRMREDLVRIHDRIDHIESRIPAQKPARS